MATSETRDLPPFEWDQVPEVIISTGQLSPTYEQVTQIAVKFAGKTWLYRYEHDPVRALRSGAKVRFIEELK